MSRITNDEEWNEWWEKLEWWQKENFYHNLEIMIQLSENESFDDGEFGFSDDWWKS